MRHRALMNSQRGRPIVIAIVTVAVVVAFAFAYSGGGAKEPDGTDGLGLIAVDPALTWSDEFDGAEGTGPDPAKWQFAIGGQGWGNQELQYYTDSITNAAHDGNGNLVITARRENPAGYACWYGACEYTSARLLTMDRFDQAYGRFEARIKFPGAGKGLWPSFWMLGNDIREVDWPTSGEIDVVEYIGSNPGRAYGTMHGPGYNGGGGVGATYDLPNGANLGDDFHTFTVDWAADSITWYVDDVLYSRKTQADIGGNKWVFDHPFYLLLNFAVGGVFPGNPDPGLAMPQQMVVDYVRVYSTTGTPQGEPGGENPDGEDLGGEDPTGGEVEGEDPSGDEGDGGGFDGEEPTGEEVDGEQPGGDNEEQTPTTATTTPTKGGGGSTSGGGKKIIGVGSGKCIDVPRSNAMDGQYLQIWDCFNTAGQSWTFAGDGTLRALGMCMDVAWGSSENGTTIQLVTCNGSPAQQFVLTSNGDLKNPATQKCVDVHAWSTSNGAHLNLWECHGGSNQKWHL